MGELKDAARTALTVCMGLKPGESCLIVTDSGKRELADAFHAEALKITLNTKLIEMPMLSKVSKYEATPLHSTGTPESLSRSDRRCSTSTPSKGAAEKPH